MGFRRQKTGKAGFTLLEMLLAVSLCVMVLLALGASFVQGAKIFQRVNRFSLEENVSFFFEKITKDLKNYAPDSLHPVLGTKDRLFFTTMVPETAEAGGAVDFKPKVVDYRFDPEKKAVIRLEGGHSEAVATQVKSCSFNFLEGGRSGITQRVTVDLECEASSGVLRFRKLIWIPVSYASNR